MSKVQFNIEIDEVLLEIFDDYLKNNQASRDEMLIAMIKRAVYGDDFVSNLFKDFRAEDDSEYAMQLAAERRAIIRKPA